MSTKNSPSPIYDNWKQANAFAMHHGILLGIVLIILLVSLFYGLTNPTASLMAWGLMIGYPIITARLTFNFRKIVAPTERFTISRGFAYSFFTMLYASIWAALALYLYFQFFDHGYFADTLKTVLLSPKMQAQLQASGLISVYGDSIESVTQQLHKVPPFIYAENLLSLNLLFSPITAFIIGLCTMRLQPQIKE